MTSQPLSAALSEATLRQIFAPLTQWEDKYRQLIFSR